MKDNTKTLFGITNYQRRASSVVVMGFGLVIVVSSFIQLDGVMFVLGGMCMGIGLSIFGMMFAEWIDQRNTPVVSGSSGDQG